MSTTTDILDFLKDGAFTGAEIADAINSDTSTVSALCNGLVKRGLVVASKDGGKNTYTRVDGDRVPTPAPTRSAAPEAGSRKPEAGSRKPDSMRSQRRQPQARSRKARPSRQRRSLRSACAPSPQRPSHRRTSAPRWSSRTAPRAMPSTSTCAAS